MTGIYISGKTGADRLTFIIFLNLITRILVRFRIPNRDPGGKFTECGSIPEALT
jgi:hypothetical protein